MMQNGIQRGSMDNIIILLTIVPLNVTNVCYCIMCSHAPLVGVVTASEYGEMTEPMLFIASNRN